MHDEILIEDGDLVVSGRAVAPRRTSGTSEECPLVVAIHGGGFTSEYFDIPGHSLVERAAARGFGVLALDRPGYGRSRQDAAGGNGLEANAVWCAGAISRLWPQYRNACSGVVLIGHSIGAAIAVILSAQQQDWPLAGVATSGAGLTPNPALSGYFAQFEEDVWVATDPDNKDRLMFGDPGTYLRGIKEVVRKAYQPVSTRELREINTVWPERALSLMGSSTVPIQFRLAEREVLWVANDVEIERVSAALTNNPGSTASLIRHAGHCTDFHSVGPEFQDSQLDFAMQCTRRNGIAAILA